MVICHINKPLFIPDKKSGEFKPEAFDRLNNAAEKSVINRKAPSGLSIKRAKKRQLRQDAKIKKDIRLTKKSIWWRAVCCVTVLAVCCAAVCSVMCLVLQS